MLAKKNNGWMQVVHLVIGIFFLFFAGNLISPIYPLTPVGMQIMGLFIGVIWLWCFVGFLWPSLLALVAFGLTDFVYATGMTMNPMQRVLQLSFGNHVAILLLFSMILFGAPEVTGATKYITRWFLTRKVYDGKPIVFAFVFFFATYALSVAVNVTPALLLMWGVLYGILTDLGYKKGEKFTSLMIVGTFLGAISGQASLPFSGSTLAILSVFEQSATDMSGYIVTIPALQYILLGFIFSVLVFICYCIFMKIVLKQEDLTKVKSVNAQMFTNDEMPPMNLIQKVNFAGMFVFIILLLAPSVFPDSWWIMQQLNTLGPAGIGILITAVMIIVRVQGEPALDFAKVVRQCVNWDIFVMVAAALAIAGALTHEATGVIAGMELLFTPLLGGHSPLVFFVIMLLFGMFVTSFASSMVIGIALMPILVTFGLSSGANLGAVASTTTLLIHYSIILPSASVFAAMLWSNEEWIKPKDVFKTGALIVAIALVIAVVVIMPLANNLF